MNFFAGRCRTGKFQKKDCLYVNSKAGSKIIFFAGGKKSGDEAYIKGYTYGTAYITEANECHQDFVQEVFDRTISSNNRKIFHDLNPKAPSDWYYRELLDFHEKQQENNPDYGYNWGKFTLLDNLSISDEKLKAVLDTYDKGTVRYEKDILGNRKQTQGLIYPRFANNSTRYLIDDIPRLMEVNIGLDFGGSKSSNALVASGITPNYRDLIAIASERHFNKDYPEGIMPQDVDNFTVKFVGKVLKLCGRCDYLYWDNESTTLGNGVKKAVETAFPQVSVRPCYKAEIKDRMDALNMLIGANRFFYTKYAVSLRDAISEAIYDPDEDNVRLDDFTTDVDSLDSLEYTFTNQIKRFIF